MREETKKILENLMKNYKQGKFRKIRLSEVNSLCDNEDTTNELINELSKRNLIVIEEQNFGLKPNEEIELIHTVQVGKDAEKILKSDIKLSDEVKKELEKRVLDKEKAYNTLFDAFDKYIKKTARSFFPKHEDEEDFYQEAMLGFLEAIDNFDFDNNTNSLSTFAWSRMMRNCQEAKERKYASVPMPHLMYERKKKLYHYREKCEQEKKPFDVKELGAIWGLPTETEKDIALINKNINLIELHINGAESLDTNISDDSKSATLGDMIPGTNKNSVELTMEKAKAEALFKLASLYLDNEQEAVFMLVNIFNYKLDQVVDTLNDKQRYLYFGRTEPYIKSYIISVNKKALVNLQKHPDEFKKVLQG